MGYDLSTSVTDACIFIIKTVFLFSSITNAQTQSFTGSGSSIFSATPTTTGPPPPATSSFQNVSIPVDAPQIIYTPFRCDVSQDETCEGGWIESVDNNEAVISSRGPNVGFIIPQMFLRFRASALYISTSPQSNATANITMSAGGQVAETQVNTVVGNIVVVNLSEEQETQMVITYVPSGDGADPPPLLSIREILLTVSDNPPTESFLPSMSLPPAWALPTFSPTATSAIPTPGGDNDKKTMIAQAVGITVGLGVGLTGIIIGGYIIWRRKRRKQVEEQTTPGMMESRHTSYVPPSAPSPLDSRHPPIFVVPPPPTPLPKLEPVRHPSLVPEPPSPNLPSPSTNNQRYSWQDGPYGSVQIPEQYRPPDPETAPSPPRISANYSLRTSPLWERMSNRRSHIEDNHSSLYY